MPPLCPCTQGPLTLALTLVQANPHHLSFIPHSGTALPSLLPPQRLFDDTLGECEKIGRVVPHKGVSTMLTVGVIFTSRLGTSSRLVL